MLRSNDCVEELFFDSNGRRIAEGATIAIGLKTMIKRPHKRFVVEQPEHINYPRRLGRLANYVGSTGMGEKEFMIEAERVKEILLADEMMANLFQGTHLPLLFPKIYYLDDPGDLLESLLIGVGKSYQQIFPHRKFNDYTEGQLTGMVKIVDESQQRLMDRLRKEPVVGYYFPNVLRGFSIKAQRQQMEGLPNNIILSGFDSVIAQVMYPDVLSGKYHTPGHDLSALQWKSSHFSLNFSSSVDSLTFGCSSSLGTPMDNYSASLFAIAE